MLGNGAKLPAYVQFGSQKSKSGLRRLCFGLGSDFPASMSTLHEEAAQDIHNIAVDLVNDPMADGQSIFQPSPTGPEAETGPQADAPMTDVSSPASTSELHAIAKYAEAKGRP